MLTLLACLAASPALADVDSCSLTNFDTVVEVAAEQGLIAPADVARLLAFRDNPSDESWIGGNR